MRFDVRKISNGWIVYVTYTTGKVQKNWDVYCADKAAVVSAISDALFERGDWSW